MAGPVFVDTWGWIALGHGQDPRHLEIKGFYQAVRRAARRVYTSDYVLDEVITLPYRRESFEEATQFINGIFGAVQIGHLIIERITSARFSAAWELRQRFHDKPKISFTDLTSFTLMQELGLTDVLTEDEHFTQVGLGLQRVHSRAGRCVVASRASIASIESIASSCRVRERAKGEKRGKGATGAG